MFITLDDMMGGVRCVPATVVRALCRRMLEMLLQWSKQDEEETRGYASVFIKSGGGQKWVEGSLAGGNRSRGQSEKDRPPLVREVFQHVRLKGRRK